MGLLVSAGRGAGVLVLQDHDAGESTGSPRPVLAVKKRREERFVAALLSFDSSFSVYSTVHAA